MAKDKPKLRQRADRITRTPWEVNPYNLQADHRAAFDPELKYALRRELAKLSVRQLEARLDRQIREGRASRPSLPDGRDLTFVQRVLDSTNSNGGNILPRVDLEQTVYLLLVKEFPVFDRVRKAPANGLKHTWNVMTATGAGSDSQLTATTDLSNAFADTATYQQDQTINIAQFETIRGVSLKELLAVQQSGMSYSPETQEMLAGTIRLKSLIQRQMLQGNASVSAGASATAEQGAYNANGFDGLRLITGGLGSYSSSAIQVDQDKTTGGGPFSITQGVNYACAQIENNGGHPSMLWGSPIVANRLMNEQEGKQRVEREELIPGVKVNAVATTSGDLPIVKAPGSGTTTNSALGNYNRTSDGVNVEDFYVLDESTLVLRWLGAEDPQVIEIPIGVDTQLSRRFILFYLGGLQVADAGLWQGKLRVPTS